jgi:hypothetical protein
VAGFIALFSPRHIGSQGFGSGGAMVAAWSGNDMGLAGNPPSNGEIMSSHPSGSHHIALLKESTWIEQYGSTEIDWALLRVLIYSDI